MRPRRALLLVNRRGRRGEQCLDDGLRVLGEAGIETETEATHEPERIISAIQQRASQFDAVIIGGGDGTLSHALDAVLESGRPLGILPMGNANDLARTLGIRADCTTACRIIAEGFTRRIDVGWLNGGHFFNVASMGLSVRIARRLTRERKLRWGVLAYLGCAWEAMRERRSFYARITCDGETYEWRSVQIAVGNGRFYGGGLTIVEDAAIDDGRLDLYGLPRVRGWRLLILLPVLRWGRHRQVTDILSLHGREIRIETSRRLDINVDGELRSSTPAWFRVVPRALEVFSPRMR
ncbi:MAG: lipid kinase [Rhodospirillales bacterium]|nr:lipid kinase [Rhodospirillales bacterium]